MKNVCTISTQVVIGTIQIKNANGITVSITRTSGVTRLTILTAGKGVGKLEAVGIFM